MPDAKEDILDTIESAHRMAMAIRLGSAVIEGLCMILDQWVKNGVKNGESIPPATIAFLSSLLKQECDKLRTSLSK